MALLSGKALLSIHFKDFAAVDSFIYLSHNEPLPKKAI